MMVKLLKDVAKQMLNQQNTGHLHSKINSIPNCIRMKVMQGNSLTINSDILRVNIFINVVSYKLECFKGTSFCTLAIIGILF